ncbi:MAG: EamA family transporter [Ruminococcaceae bacterium]|nr:EamA family transporter [Oscillospiraceae bacterium]
MNTQKNNSAISALQVLLAALLWGTLGVFVTFLRQAGFSTLQIVFLRAAVSVLLLGIFIFLRDRSKFRIRLRDSWIFIGTGLISFTLFTVCNQIAMRLCSLSIAAALLYTSPAFILIFSAVIFRERLTAAKLISIAVTVFGCFLVSGLLTPGAVISGAGILAGIASGLCYGLYSIFGRFGVEKYDSLTVTFYTFLLAAAASLPFADFASMPAVFSSADWVLPLVCAFGPVTCLLPYLFYTAGLAGLEPSTAGILATLEPVVSALLSVLIFHEDMNWQKVLGMVCILGSVVIVNLHPAKKKTK